MQIWRDLSPPFYCIAKIETRAPHEAADDSADALLKTDALLTTDALLILLGDSGGRGAFFFN